MPSILSKLFLGHSRNTTPLKSAYKNQWLIFIRVWRNRSNDDYGIERLVRLVLAIFPFCSLGLFIRQIFGPYGIQVRNMAIDTYVLVKVCLSMYVLYIIQDPLWLIIPLYFSIETIMYIFSLIFLSDLHTHPVLIRRTIMLVLLNFLEINVTFASVYEVLERLHPGSFYLPAGASMLDPLTALYFSFITAGTIGYGDIAPASPMSKIMVLTQITLSFIFVVLFISYFTGRFTSVIHQQSRRKK